MKRNEQEKMTFNYRTISFINLISVFLLLLDELTLWSSLGIILNLSWDSLSIGSWGHSLWKSEVLSKVLNTLWGKDVVVVSPVVGLLSEALGDHGSHDTDDL